MKTAAKLLLLLPVPAAAQEASATATRLPYLWGWVAASLVVLAALVYLLFVSGPRDRARAHAAHRARREVQDRP